MDNKRLITGMLLVMALVFGYQAFMGYLRKTHPEWFPTPPAQVAQNAPATQSVTVYPTSGPATEQFQSASAPAVQPAAATQPAPVVRLGSGLVKDPRFAMLLDISPRGAAIESITLNDFKREAKKNDRYVFQRPYRAQDAHSPDPTRPFTTLAVIINGTSVPVADALWELDGPPADRSVTYRLDLAGPLGPMLRIRKTYTLPDRQDVSGGYEIAVGHQLQNLTAAPMTASLVIGGPTMPPPELDRPPDRSVVAGYNDDQRVHLVPHAIESFTADKPFVDLTKSDKGQAMLWAGMSSVYFEALVLPTVGTLAAAKAQLLNVAHGPDEKPQVGLTLETAAVTLEAAASSNVDFAVFMGPKKRSLLNGPHFAAFPRGYDQSLVTGGGCAICTFQWLINILVWLLEGFHFVLRDWGLAIIALVILVRLALHPITKKSTINMQKMGKMGPEMERLKKKYGENKDELNRAMMQFYKEQGATPILGCLPMFLQMPIWIALWSALQGTFELRQAPFLRVGGVPLTWISDLAKPDRLIYFPNQAINLWFFHLDALNILPLLLALVFYLQQKYTPQPAATTKEMEQQQKMMKWMSVALFPLLLYTGPSGLNLYILTSTTIGIFESKRIRAHIQAREEAEKAGRIIVEARPTRAGRKLQDQKPAEAKPRGGIMGWLAEMQSRAEQMRRENERRKEGE